MQKNTLTALLAIALVGSGLSLLVRHSPEQAAAIATPAGGIDLENTRNRLDQWVHYSRDYNGQRFSPDDQLHRGNVGALELKWKKTFKYNPAGFQATALVFDDFLYITDRDSLVKVDPESGDTVWTWSRPEAPRAFEAKKYLLGGANRGAVVSNGRIYKVTNDAHLVCIDAETGILLWDRVVADDRAGYGLTGAPLVVKDKVIVGISGAEYGIRGFIDAYNAETGFREWRFWVVPGPGEPGNETWAGDSWQRGGGSAWLTGTYDADLDRIYWGTSNPAPVFNGSARQGDNLYTNSIIALNPDSGELDWYFQTSPHDLFDWSGVSEPILFEGVFEGKRTPALVQANRNGYAYVLDRRDGSLIGAYPFTRVDWAELNAEGKPVIKPELLSAKVREVFPGNAGGTNWAPKAYSPRTGLLYIPNIERGSTFVAVPSEYRRGQLYMGGVTTFEDEPGRGSIEAMDVTNGAIRWSFDTGGPNWGGLLATAGGLVFGGAFDGKLRAFNDETGDVLWEYATGVPAYAPATTFRIKGKQYIGMSSGFGLIGQGTAGHGPQPKGHHYYLFGLPDADHAD
ncbi:MAG: PQQ-dependent dehydrogenase, methanol/ethanol family [Pseudomonadota bacterium]